MEEEKQFEIDFEDLEKTKERKRKQKFAIVCPGNAYNNYERQEIGYCFAYSKNQAVAIFYRGRKEPMPNDVFAVEVVDENDQPIFEK